MGKAIRDLAPFNVQQYLAGRSCSAATRNKTRSYLFSFCKWLVEQDRLPANPVEKVKPARAKAADVATKRRRRAYTLAELRAVDRRTERRGSSRLAKGSMSVGCSSVQHVAVTRSERATYRTAGGLPFR